MKSYPLEPDYNKFLLTECLQSEGNSSLDFHSLRGQEIEYFHCWKQSRPDAFLDILDRQQLADGRPQLSRHISEQRPPHHITLQIALQILEATATTMSSSSRKQYITAVLLLIYNVITLSVVTKKVCHIIKTRKKQRIFRPAHTKFQILCKQKFLYFIFCHRYLQQFKDRADCLHFLRVQWVFLKVFRVGKYRVIYHI